MATPHLTSSFQLVLHRTFAAPRELVFAAWTEPARIKKWMCKTSMEGKTEFLEFDVRPGGRFRLNVTNLNGDVYNLHGQYQEIRVPERLVYTWNWQRKSGEGSRSDDIGQTLITVEFFERGPQTEIILTHSGFPTAEICDLHKTGWPESLDAMEQAL
jgi:uncharacterized protein YndB with AHSA1/START domain